MSKRGSENMPASHLEATERALGNIIARQQAQVEIVVARGEALVARLETRNAELQGRIGELERMVSASVEAGISQGIEALRTATAAAENARAAEARGLAERLEAAEVRAAEAEARLAAVEAREPEVTRGDIDALNENIGSAFAQIDGLSRMEGPPGPQGEPGERGEAGPPGRDADPELVREMVTEAVQRAVEALPIPEKGDRGDVGPAGPQGDPGAPGRDVDPEQMREAIAEAVQRAVEALPAPEKGDKGDPGERGLQGEPGAPGRLPVARAWSERVHYEGEVVTHAGATWQADRDTGREPPHDDWRCLAAAGQDGRTPDFRGLFGKDEEYRALDVVMLDGNSFVALRDEPGACPGDGWKLLSMRGKPGKPGDKGERGERGEKGKPGEPLVSAEVRDDGTILYTNGDGSTVEADLYPLLEKVQRG